MTKRRKGLIVAVLVVVIAAAAWIRYGGHRVPAGQAQLGELNAATLDTLQADFNAASEQTRIILLLSPGRRVRWAGVWRHGNDRASGERGAVVAAVPPRITRQST